ncbi:unnamed protein product [Blepharisma stoltei]|uniref:Uncharacterized protein n=1 Tax=Blepharisma stoltei TaxID=1481888 RepID=A0AAU9J263_9CILI|nr:unnamed protein product [Blepharisma stoltei]
MQIFSKRLHNIKNINTILCYYSLHFYLNISLENYSFVELIMSKFIVLVLTLLIASSGTEPNLKFNIYNCIVDTVVLEEIILEMAMEISSIWYIQEGFHKMLFVFSLIPQWMYQCIPLIVADTATEDPNIDFIPLSDKEILVNGKLVEISKEEAAEDSQAWADCKDVVADGLARLINAKDALDSQDYQTMVENLLSMKSLKLPLLKMCKGNRI